MPWQCDGIVWPWHTYTQVQETGDSDNLIVLTPIGYANSPATSQAGFPTLMYLSKKSVPQCGLNNR